MSKKIVITPSSFGKCGPEPFDMLKQENYELVINPYGRRLTAGEVINLGKGCEGIIAGVEPLNSEVLNSLSDLRCISRVGSGIDNIDIKCARKLGIVVKNTPQGPTRAVAELTVGLIFDALRNISQRDREIRKGKWNKKMGNLLMDKKVGIIGLGRIGKTVADLLLAIGARVYATDIKPDEMWAKQRKIKLLSFEEILKSCDINCIHVSTKTDDKPLIDKRELDLMKKDSYLINVSRGGVVDEDALYNALKKGEIAGAAVDVFNKEPYTGKLTTLENIALTSHIGSYAKETRLDMEVQSVKNLLEVLKKS